MSARSSTPGTTTIQELAPLETTLEWKGQEGTTVPVHLQARVTEVGVLELWCVSRDGTQRWKLEFNVRVDAVTRRASGFCAALATISHSGRSHEVRRTVQPTQDRLQLRVDRRGAAPFPARRLPPRNAHRDLQAPADVRAPRCADHVTRSAAASNSTRGRAHVLLVAVLRLRRLGNGRLDSSRLPQADRPPQLHPPQLALRVTPGAVDALVAQTPAAPCAHSAASISAALAQSPWRSGTFARIESRNICATLSGELGLEQ